MIVQLFGKMLSYGMDGLSIVSARARFEATTLLAESWWTSVTVGRWAFALLFLFVVIWLLAIPARRIGQTAGAPPWWRNVRFWAIFAAAVQILVYALWG